MGSVLEKKTEDRISELDDISIEFTLSEPEREKTEKKLNRAFGNCGKIQKTQHSYDQNPKWREEKGRKMKKSI